MRKLLRLLVSFFWKPGGHGPGLGPTTGVRVPRGSSPRGRGAAVALAEPEPDVFVDAVGRTGARRAK
jgi:hypothetical protein